jgi:hypothetical protein
MTYTKPKINIPARAKKNRAVNILIVEVLFWRKKANCSDVVPQ